MKVIILIFAFILVSCGIPRPQYQTRKGRTKQNYYNAIQFGDKEKRNKLQKKYNKAIKNK